jgi:beta-glucosidase/6-phospho-beta-glucosidase/beta-galactosidase
VFADFVWGGFEGASHRRHDGKRVDSIAGTQHDRWAMLDHAILRSLGVRCARESLRWHLIERRRGEYDFTSALEQVRGARAAGMRVVWGLCHWGVPDHLDVMSPEFPRALADFARACVRMLRAEGADVAGWVPVNEMAFWAWAGGETGGFGPYLMKRGDQLKHQLVRGHLAAVRALREAGALEPIMVCEPLIWVVPREGRNEEAQARAEVEASFAALDQILAEDASAIDVVGFNYYPHNQWTLLRRTVRQGSRAYRPLRELLRDAARRFDRPIIISETGAEDPMGDAWLGYIAAEAQAALDLGVDLQALCVYPILDYPGWDNGRHCPCGPIGTEDGRRFVRPGQRAALQRLGALRARSPVR